MEPTPTARLPVLPDWGSLAQLQREVGLLLGRHGVASEVGFAIELAVEELVSNVIRHGSDGARKPRIEVSLTITSDEVTVVIEDDAPAFDPLSAPPPDFDLPIEERPIGGLGLHLVRQLSHELAYRRAGGRNVVEIRFDRAGTPDTP